MLGAVLAGCLRGAACSLNGALHHDAIRARARVRVPEPEPALHHDAVRARVRVMVP